MTERLYSDLASLWRRFSPPERYAEEAELALAWCTHALGRRPASWLELGAGGGHLASHLPQDLDLVLVDKAPAMVELCRSEVPRALAVEADMRDLELGRTVDAVLLHDAVMYLTSREDLLRAFRAAHRHLAPGGALLVLPDLVREDFQEQTILGGSHDLQVLEWHWDPDPTDDTYRVEFAFLLRAGGAVTCHHDTHTFGLFERQTWVRTLREAGFELLPPEPYDPREGGEVFLCRKLPGA